MNTPARVPAVRFYPSRIFYPQSVVEYIRRYANAYEAYLALAYMSYDPYRHCAEAPTMQEFLADLEKARRYLR